VLAQYAGNVALPDTMMTACSAEKTSTSTERVVVAQSGVAAETHAKKAMNQTHALAEETPTFSVNTPMVAALEFLSAVLTMKISMEHCAIQKPDQVTMELDQLLGNVAQVKPSTSVLSVPRRPTAEVLVK